MILNKIAYDPADRASFVAARLALHKENRLGGSDLGTAAGVNKYKSRRRLYEEIKGHVAAPDIGDRQAVKDGVRCEDMVARLFEARTGKKVHRVNAVMTSDAAPHLFASIDRKVENEDAGLECKTANALNKDAFANGALPPSYARQVKTYMKVTGYRIWYVYVWIMGIKELCYIYTLDPIEKPAWCDTLVTVREAELNECEEIAADFFNAYVLKDTPPPFDGVDDEAELLKELHPTGHPGTVVRIEKVTEADLCEYDQCKKTIKHCEERMAAIENRIKEELADAAEGAIGTRKVTWKNNKPSEKTDWKAVAIDAQASTETIAAHTTLEQGARVLRIK